MTSKTVYLMVIVVSALGQSSSSAERDVHPRPVSKSFVKIMKSLSSQVPNMFRSRRSYLDNRIDTFPEHNFYHAQHRQDIDPIDRPFSRAMKHIYDTELAKPRLTDPEYMSQGLTNPEYMSQGLTNQEFTDPLFTNTRRFVEAPQEEPFTPLLMNRFKGTPLDIESAPEGEEDLEMEDLEELLSRPLSPKLDLNAPVPQALVKEMRGSLDDYLDFLELRDSGALDKCLPRRK